MSTAPPASPPAVLRPASRSLGERLVAGDEDAMQELFRRFERPVRTIVRDLVGGPRLVDDGIQETFVKIWRMRARFDPSRPLDPWVYQIARNVARDLRRRESRHQRRCECPPLGEATFDDLVDDDDAADPAASLERRERADLVERAMAALPLQEGEVLRLRHLAGWSEREISDRLGVQTGTVKSRAHRGRERLRALIA